MAYRSTRFPEGEFGPGDTVEVDLEGFALVLRKGKAKKAKAKPKKEEPEEEVIEGEIVA